MADVDDELHDEEEEEQLDEPWRAEIAEAQAMGDARGGEVERVAEQQQDDPKGTGCVEWLEIGGVELGDAEADDGNGGVEVGRGEEHPCGGDEQEGEEGGEDAHGEDVGNGAKVWTEEFVDDESDAVQTAPYDEHP